MPQAATAPAQAIDIDAGDIELTPKVLARRAGQRRQMLILIGASYLVDGVLLLLYHLAGATPLSTPVGYLGCGLSVTGFFLLLSETHVNDRFKDHYLTSIQNAVGALVQLTWIWLAPEVGYFFLCIMFIVVGFGALRMTSRQAAIAWTTLAVGLAVLFLLTNKPIDMPMNGYFERAITMLCLVTTIGRFSFVGLYGSMMRETLYKSSKELKRAYARIEELAQFDELTGALNRRSIMAALDEEIARAARTNTPCSVALLDLDHFKRVNDQFGHPAGDEALRAFAITLFANIRAIDKLGRYGGEEFLLILPGTALEPATKTLNRLRMIISELDWSAISTGLKVTMSAGISAVGPDDTSDVILARTDAALYRAKDAGRNRVMPG